MNPLIIVALVSALISGSGAWLVTSAVKNGEIAAIEKAHAEQRAATAQTALDDLTKAAKAVHDAASTAQVDVATVNAKLDGLRKEIKNAKPLPVDCRPDAIRMRNLQSSVEAVNQAAAGR